MNAPTPDRSRNPGGLSYQELLDADGGSPAASLRIVAPPFDGVTDVPVSRYTSRAYHEAEKQHLWSRVWQMACREEDLPEVGDTVVYDIVDRSYLLVRTAPDEVRAYVNACLHRGRRLRDADGRADELRCAFHGFCWELGGALREVPCMDTEFPQIAADREAWALPQVQVGHWGGFVFVNPDPDAPSLHEFLGALPEHFAKWPLDRRVKVAHVARVIDANWKVVQEAFMESYHVITTHPQLLASLSDTRSQYDAFGTFSRAISASGVPSPHLSVRPSEQDIMDAVLDRALDEPAMVTLPDGVTARQALASAARNGLRRAIGDAADELSDGELADNFFYTVFPNFHPWGAYNRITYRFRPNGDDHRSSIMECMLLAPYAGERPPAAKVHWLERDQPFTDAVELGVLGRIFEQDVYNLPEVQRGLETMTKPTVTFAAYQETKLRHLHTLLGAWVPEVD